MYVYDDVRDAVVVCSRRQARAVRAVVMTQAVPAWSCQRHQQSISLSWGRQLVPSSVCLLRSHVAAVAAGWQWRPVLQNFDDVARRVLGLPDGAVSFDINCSFTSVENNRHWWHFYNNVPVTDITYLSDVRFVQQQCLLITLLLLWPCYFV